jgi:branched-chain amino acid aminotransferase
MPTSIRLEPTTASRRDGVDLADVAFSSVFSDHMLIAEFRDGGWEEVVIRPYGPLSLLPTITALQYGISVFEGLKAHRLAGGDLALFRPGENARRIVRSAARLAMPAVPEAMFLDGLRALVRLDERWVPAHGAGALYIRPCLFSIDPSVRVKPAERFLFTIVTAPFSRYYAAPVDVLVTERWVRAFPGGTGAVKPGGNYAPALVADREARDSGCDTVLWLDGLERRYIEECGVMNVFFVLDDRVVTPELSGTILPGVTRDSAISLLRDMGHTVEERRIGVDELQVWHGRGKLRECFGTGTAATLTHVRRIRHREVDLVLPAVEERTVGPALRERLMAIMTGDAPDPHGWLEKI